MEKDIQDKVSKLQLIEQNVSSLIAQKQNFEHQIMEIDNALEEISKDNKEVYKIVGPIMIASETENLKKELVSKKDIVTLRIKNFEKQEKRLKEEASVLQKEIMNGIKK